MDGSRWKPIESACDWTIGARSYLRRRRIRVSELRVRRHIWALDRATCGPRLLLLSANVREIDDRSTIAPVRTALSLSLFLFAFLSLSLCLFRSKSLKRHAVDKGGTRRQFRESKRHG